MPLKLYSQCIEEYPDLKEINECLVCLVAFEVPFKINLKDGRLTKNNNLFPPFPLKMY